MSSKLFYCRIKNFALGKFCCKQGQLIIQWSNNLNFANFLTDQKRPFQSETKQKHCVDEKGLTDNRGRLEVGSQRE